jgi:hypothetical protein
VKSVAPETATPTSLTFVYAMDQSGERRVRTEPAA